MPFSIVETKWLECKFGPHYFKERKQTGHRVQLQGCGKMGSHGHIEIKQCSLYPQYKAESSIKTSLRTAKEYEMKRLKSALSTNPEKMESVTMYYVSLPMKEAVSGHLTGVGIAGFAQRMNDKVEKKIAES